MSTKAERQATKVAEPVPASERETEPAIEDAPPTLPAGVQMHETGTIPYARPVPEEQRDMSKPPPGWKGSYSRCGGCGAFLGNADRCAKCSPAGAGAPHFVNHPTVIA